MYYAAANQGRLSTSFIMLRSELGSRPEAPAQ